MDYETFESQPGIYFLNLAVMLAATAAVYGAGPLLFLRLRKRPVTQKCFRLFCILYTCAIAIGFFTWRALSGAEGGSFIPAILWGTVFYRTVLARLRMSGRIAAEYPSEIPHDGDPLAQDAEAEIKEPPGGGSEPKEKERPVVYHGIYGEYVQHPMDIELSKILNLKKAEERQERSTPEPERKSRLVWPGRAKTTCFLLSLALCISLVLTVSYVSRAVESENKILELQEEVKALQTNRNVLDSELASVAFVVFDETMLPEQKEKALQSNVYLRLLQLAGK